MLLWRPCRAGLGSLVLVLGEALSLQESVAAHLQPSAQTVTAARLDAFEAAAGAHEHLGYGKYPQNLINFGNAQYVAYVTVGRQIIAGMPDTGSNELVLFGADCRSCGAAAHYNPHLSDTYKEGVLMTQQNFGSGNTMSVIAKEKVAMGPWTSQNQSFWNVKDAQMSVLFSAAFEAIVGLGPPEVPLLSAWESAEAAVNNVTEFLNTGAEVPQALTDGATAMITVAREMKNHAPVLRTFRCHQFSICLGAKPDSDGTLIWQDTTYIERPELFSRVEVTGKNNWGVTLSEGHLKYPDDEAPDGKDWSKELGCEQGCTALVDSGTSLLAVPTRVRRALEMAVSVLNHDCTNLQDLPELQFSLGGVPFSLPPDAYLAQVVGDATQYLQRLGPHMEMREGRRCQLMLMETNGNGPDWILGQPFFRKYYTTFVTGEPKDPRALYIATHAEQDCVPVDDQTGSQLPRQPVRYMSAERVRLPQLQPAQVHLRHMKS